MNRHICRIQLAGADRWVSLSLSLGDLAPPSRFIFLSEGLLYEFTGLDESSQKYDLSNWQGGVISGARYAFRALKTPLRQVHIHELRGQLGSGDVAAVSSAAAVAVARLLGRPLDFPVDLAGWKLEEEVSRPRPIAAGITSQGEEAVPCAPEPGQAPVEESPPSP